MILIQSFMAQPESISVDGSIPPAQCRGSSPSGAKAAVARVPSAGPKLLPGVVILSLGQPGSSSIFQRDVCAAHRWPIRTGSRLLLGWEWQQAPNSSELLTPGSLGCFTTGEYISVLLAKVFGGLPVNTCNPWPTDSFLTGWAVSAWLPHSYSTLRSACGKLLLTQQNWPACGP